MESVKNEDWETIQRIVGKVSAKFVPHLSPPKIARGKIGEVKLPVDFKAPTDIQVYAVSPTSSALDVLTDLPAGAREGTVCFVRGEAPHFLWESGLNFIDRAGNAFLHFPGIYIEIQGKKLSQKAKDSREKTGVIFPKAYLRVIFVLLSYPQLLKAKVVDIAESAGVSPATVSGAFRMLVREGYLVAEGRYRRLRYSKKLIAVWAEHYRTSLLPSVRERAVQGFEPQDWRQALEDYSHDFVLSGENALATLGLGIVPETTTIYGVYPWKELMRDYKLRPDTSGKTLLREKFWKAPAGQEEGRLAPLLLIYADCLASQDSRQIEVAERLVEKIGDL